MGQTGTARGETIKDKGGALSTPSRVLELKLRSRIVLRKVLSLNERDPCIANRRRERFAWRLTQSTVDEENVTVARSASDGASGEVVDKYDTDTDTDTANDFSELIEVPFSFAYTRRSGRVVPPGLSSVGYLVYLIYTVKILE